MILIVFVGLDPFSKPPLPRSAAPNWQDWSEVLTDDPFPSIDAGRRLRFPDDFAPHPAQRSEAWRFAGRLFSAQGQVFGFQLSFMRLNLKVAGSANEDWTPQAVWRAELALSDVSGGRFLTSERLNRAVLGLAGADAAVGRIWLDDWSATLPENDTPQYRVQAETTELAFRLELSGRQAPVPLIPANTASEQTLFRAYLVPQLITTGSLRLGEDSYTVQGQSWLEHGWGRLGLGRGQLSADRFILHFDDGREFVGLRLHRRGGGGTPIINGLLIEADGSIRRFDRHALTLIPENRWRSPGTGAAYPLYWQLNIPTANIAVQITPWIKQQEIDSSLRYWSGWVRLQNSKQDTGYGLVELRGYPTPAD